ncbi:MAG: LPXTG cell wall anchor domain-containing protein, partial [Clostridiales bacterium]|nr:LPXTG cell wall anchor domain-containing protein [Clostridiales bacterium]
SKLLTLPGGGIIQLLRINAENQKLKRKDGLVMKKILALLMAGVLCMGMSVTAFASEVENPSQSVDSGDVDEADNLYDYISSAEDVTGTGGVTVTPLDEAGQELVMYGLWYDEIFYTTWDDEWSNFKNADGDEGFMSIADYAFDVTNASGKVVVSLGADAVKYAGHLCFVYHYDATAGAWEVMSSFAEVDSNGCIAFEFASYSPIYVEVLDVTKDNWVGSSTISVLTTDTASTGNDTATATTTSTSTTSSSPKTGDNYFALIIALIALCAASGVVITRKKMFQ